MMPQRYQKLIQVACLGALLAPAPARAVGKDLSLEGNWSASALHSEWAFGEWGEACGPRPTSTGVPAGPVIVSQVGGELQFSGAAWQYSTTQCGDQFPGLTRVVHRTGNDVWQNTCKSSPNDARQVTVITTVTASAERIAYDEASQYRFLVNGKSCTTSVRRSRVLSRKLANSEPAETSASAVASVPPPTSAEKPAPPVSSRAGRCAEVGPPQRLEVKPARKVLRPGESFQFRARVSDRNYCPITAPVAFRALTKDSALRVKAHGLVEVPEDAKESTTELIATVADRAVKLQVEVVARERYEALLEQQGLSAEGESGESADNLGNLAAVGARSSIVQDTSHRRRMLFVGVLAATALLLGVLGLKMGLGRARAKAKKARPQVSTLTPTARVCLTCKQEYPPNVYLCERDGSPLVATYSGALEELSAVCPVCARGFESGVSVCPTDGRELVPVASYTGSHSSIPPTVEMICPVCGAYFPGGSSFCGGCGAALVPVN